MHLFVRQIIARTFVVLMLICSSAPYANPAPLELGQLIRQVLEQQKGGFLDWSFLSRQESPVTWFTDGIDFKDYTRRGAVVAAVDGFIPEVLQKTVTVQPWSIVLSGSKHGITAVHLANDGCFGTTSLSSECAAKIARIPQSLSSSNVAMEKICEFGPGAAHSEIYRITVAESSPAYLHIQIGGGSGGVFIDASVILQLATPPDVPVLLHDSAVCGLMFVAHNGPDGFPAWDYRHRLNLQP